MDKSLDRQPVQAILLLLAGAAVYYYVLMLAVNYQVGIPEPGFMRHLITDKKALFSTWDQLTHLLAVLAVSTPFAWLLTRLVGRRLLLAAAVVVAPTVIWMVLDYFAMSAELPQTPAAVDLFYGIETLEAALTLPLLVWLLRPARP